MNGISGFMTLHAQLTQETQGRFVWRHCRTGLYGDEQLRDKSGGQSLSGAASLAKSSKRFLWPVMGVVKLGGLPGTETYIDDALFVADQQVPEQPGLVQVAQHYHVVHTFHRAGVHGADAALGLLVNLVLLHPNDHYN